MLVSKQVIDIMYLDEKGGMSSREIASAVGTSHQNVLRTLKRLKELGLSYLDLLEMEPETILAVRYPSYGKRTSSSEDADWEWVHLEKQKKGNTLRLIYFSWVAKSEQNTMKYSTFCRKYRSFKKESKISMKLTHYAGECVQGDFGGKTLKVNFSTKPIQFFFGTHGHSQFVHALATPDQTTKSWIKGFEHVFTESNGVPEVLIPDNPKSLVTRYAPNRKLNPFFEAFAKHYGVTVIPAKPGCPKGKALVELTVKLFNQSILPKLKKLNFRSIEDVNAALQKEVKILNEKKFQRRSTSRQSLFEKFDKPMLKKLPSKPFNPLEKVFEFNLGEYYYVTVEEHSYSVPYRNAHKRVQVHVYQDTVKVFREHKLIAEHVRSFKKGGSTSVDEHKDPRHLWSEEKPLKYYQDWASETFGDECVAELLSHFFDSKYTHSKRGNDRARKFMRFTKHFTNEQVTGACRYALKMGQVKNVDMVHSIMKSGVYEVTADDIVSAPGALIRGGDYYKQMGETI